jgi:hypothetical protein
MLQRLGSGETGNYDAPQIRRSGKLWLHLGVSRATRKPVCFQATVGNSTSLLQPTYGTDGLQTVHGLCLAAASCSGIGIALLRSELQPARWYLVPLFIT